MNPYSIMLKSGLWLLALALALAIFVTPAEAAKRPKVPTLGQVRALALIAYTERLEKDFRDPFAIITVHCVQGNRKGKFGRQRFYCSVKVKDRTGERLLGHYHTRLRIFSQDTWEYQEPFIAHGLIRVNRGYHLESWRTK